jgi:hypothetical protein
VVKPVAVTADPLALKVLSAPELVSAPATFKALVDTAVLIKVEDVF